MSHKTNLMPYIDLEEIYLKCDDREKKELAQWLVDEGYLATPTKAQTSNQEVFYNHMMNIKNCYHQISSDDMEKIFEISNMYLINDKLK